MQKFQGLSFVLNRSYICYYTICMTVPLIQLLILLKSNFEVARIGNFKIDIDFLESMKETLKK